MEAVAGSMKTQTRILSPEGHSLIKSARFVVLNRGPPTILQAWMVFFAFVPMWSSNKQNKHACKNGAWILTLEHKRVQSLAGFLSSASFLLLYQFKLLPELFQDEEKVLSPTSAAPSGRVPLSRTAVKPAKARPGQASKEHKKTVGHQVSVHVRLC